MLSTKYLRNDLLGGLTTGIVALPLALGLGVQSGMGAEAGLYGAIFLGFIAALLGGTRLQVSGPTGPMTVISALVIATFIHDLGSFSKALPFILSTFASAGLFQILFAILRLGNLIHFVPYAVISGFMTGIGLIIILLQLFPMMGHQAPGNLIDVIKHSDVLFSHPNFYSLGLTLGTLAIIYIMPKFFRAIPGSLIALISLSLIATYCQLPITTIGTIPSGLPTLHLDIFTAIAWENHIWTILKYGLVLAALGSIDSLLTSVVVDNMTHTRHNSKRELFGQGVGNFVGALLGALPGAGATMRSVVNINNGSKTRLAGVVHSIVLLTILLGANRYASVVPMPVLSGVLINVGLSIIDYRGFKQLLKIPRTEAIITIIVTLMTVFVDLITAVGIGVLLSTLHFMQSMTAIGKEQACTFKFEEENNGEKMPPHLEGKVYIKHLEGPFFFGIASECKQLLTGLPDIAYVIIRMNHVPYIDQSGAYALEDGLDYLQKKGIRALFTDLQPQPNKLFNKLNIVDHNAHKHRVFATFSDCCKWLQQA